MKTDKSVSNTSVVTKDVSVNVHHIDVLDGIRALAIMIVVWYHLWQLCWLTPVWQTPALSFLRINEINFDWLTRTGYMMVTMMILLSGFCLYLPYARHDISGEPLPTAKTFYKKRFARIVPSYMFCVFAVFIYDIIKGLYVAADFPLNGESGFWAKDLLTHLTFTFNLSPQVQMHSQLNGALWTVALEVQFYLIFPLLVKAFRKKPIVTYVVMSLISFGATFYAKEAGNINFLMHQLPTYLGVYSNGFMGAAIFVGMGKTVKRNKYIAGFATIVSIMCIYVYYLMMQSLLSAIYEGNGMENKWQMHNRYYASLLFVVFCIATAYSLGFYRKIFSNKVSVFLATISFNLYMWHQFLAVAFVKNHIPFYEGDTPPNQLNDRPWMWKYLIICVIASFAVAILTTYLIEKPMANLILGKSGKKDGKKGGSDKQVLKKPDKNAIRNKKSR